MILITPLCKQMRDSGLIKRNTVRELLRKMKTLIKMNYSCMHGHLLTELTKPQREVLKTLDIPFLDPA
ncbi:MAG TPA: hypothetical protein VN371_07050 [Chlorobaculum sp.]|nr:hypothetical protein [Chlorobaculum sp.]